MSLRFRRALSRIVAISLLFAMLTVDASAVVKEVNVFGVRSINDEGYSDNRVTMEQLEDDYSDFVQTDTLREYFHRDQEDPAKVDMSEALSWLIDHEVICRDQTIQVTGFDSNRIPVVNIDKMDVSELEAKIVTRSDAIMYVYKAVFGPIDARTVGLETDNVRVDNGVRKTLYDMMLDHDYFNTINRVPNSIVQSESTGGDQSVSQSCVSTPLGHYDSQSVTSQGGTAGQQTLGYAGNINSQAIWRYTPQGDKYDSIFGDTNIFISNNNIAQQGNTGPGTQGLGIGSSTGTSSPDINVDVNNDGTHYNGEGPQQNGNHNSQQTGWAGTGGLNQGISIESDYKQIYYAPGADLMFYRTNDVLELYIKSALSKGLLSYDQELRTEEFTKTFIDGNTKGVLETWSPGAPAYIVNRHTNKLVTAVNIKNSQIKETMGKNFDVTYHNNNFLIQRRNLFEGNSGYFSTEKLFKMDVYRYIYTFIGANEKKLSDLESDIVNYKYGMELEGVAASEDDTQILKYLIAKGILSFDDTADFTDLYQAMNYDAFLRILYRVANPNARLDFSKVQLTDSETAWRAKGFAPQSLYVVAGTTPTTPAFVINPEITATKQEPQGSDSDGTGTEATPPTVASRTFDTSGALVASEMSADEVISMVNANSLSIGAQKVQRVGLGDYELGTVETTGVMGDMLVYGGYSLDPIGIYLSPSSGDGEWSVAGRLKNLIKIVDDNSQQTWGEESWGKKTACKENIRQEICNNFWVITLCRANTQAYNDAMKVFDEELKILREKKANSQATKEDNNKITALSQLQNTLKANVETSGSNCMGPKANSIKLLVKTPASGTTTVWTSTTGNGAPSGNVERGNYLLSNLVSVGYTFVDSSGNETPITIEVTTDGFTPAADVLTSRLNAKGIVTTQSSKVMTPGDSSSFESEISQIVNSTMEAVGVAAANTGSVGTKDAAATGSKITQYTNGAENFLAWSQIVAFNSTQTNTDETIQIERVSDLILVNKQTNTRAYFSQGTNAVALVGTAVVQGDPVRGVAFKDGDGASAEYYYHVDAIRLLMNARQESAVLSGLRNIALADKAVQQSLQPVRLQSESGHSESSLVGLKVLLDKENDDTTAGGDRNSAYFKGTTVEQGARWGKFLSLSQSNRAVNAISRRITYKSNGTGATRIAYAVVVFEPVDIEKVGSAQVKQGMSMQDILDAAVKPPSTTAGQTEYNRNMTLANAYANWIYGTSGKTYINTGYLTPKAYFYYPLLAELDAVPVTVKGCLTDEQFKGINFGTYNLVSGAVCKLDEQVMIGPGEWDQEHNANYMLTSDYRVMITGERVYLCESACTNLSYRTGGADGPYYVATNGTARAASFSLGTSFALRRTQAGEGVSTPWLNNLKATVIETKSDGTVVCQYGPIKGLPFKYGATDVVLNTTDFIDDAGGEIMIWKSSYVTDPTVNRLKYVEEKILRGYTGATYGGVCKNPMMSTTKSYQNAVYVYADDQLRAYTEKGSKLEKKISIPNFSANAYSGWGVSDIAGKLQKDIGATTSVNDAETYITFSFSAFNHQVRGGVLIYSPSSVSDFLSPSLFTNLNDLIIDEMMNVQNGAVPINEVPSDALLKVGNGYYASKGEGDENAVREFIGYAHLANSTTGAFKPQVQDVAKSFADHYIRGGSQYINVSHYFTECHVLPTADRDMQSRQSALDKVKSATLSTGTKPFICVNSQGSTSSIYNPPEDGGEGAALYAPVSISFQPVLLAYPSGKVTAGGEEIDVYTICPDAANSVAGPFEDLDFFTNSVMEDSLLDITAELTSASFTNYAGDSAIMMMLEEQFQKAFQGDLFTLARMIVFIILIWLFVASWLCYGFYAGNLMPIIDAIKYPTRDRGARGIDLMKLVSFGTISVDSDFKLGRFLQYDAILAILILIVWKSGNISF